MPNDIYIYGDIGSSWWDDSGITDSSVLAELNSLSPSDSLNVHINTLGGETHHGLAIFNVLRNYAEKQRVLNPDFILKTIVDGVAYSAGSIIMLAGDQRIMQMGSKGMIHSPWMYSSGNHIELQKAAAYLKSSHDALAMLYSQMTGKKDAAEFDKLMNEETYFDPKQAVEIGLATSAEEPKKSDSNSRKNPYESLMADIEKLAELGKGAYVKAMISGKFIRNPQPSKGNNSEKNSRIANRMPIERLTRELICDRLYLSTLR